MFRSLLRQVYSRVVEGAPPVAAAGIDGATIRGYVNKPDPVILEIGSNDGAHALWFGALFERPTVHCFEPDPRAIERFEKKVGNRDGIHLYKLALSDQEGEIDFHQSSGERVAADGEVLFRDWDLSGSIKTPKNHLKKHPWVTFDRPIKVRTTTLDAWCAEQRLAHIDFIWMDVQGAELDVIRGGRETFARTAFVYTEYNNEELYTGQPSLRRLLRHLEGFRVLVRYPDDVLLANKSLSWREPSPGVRATAGRGRPGC
jgi:2-O-methyltransferase